MIAEKKMIYELYLKPVFVHNRITTESWKINNSCMSVHNLVYIYEGSGIFGRENGKRQVKTGDLVYFPIGKPQYMTTDSKNPLKLYTVNFYASLPKVSGGKWYIEEAEFLFPFIKSLEDEAIRKRFEVLFERLCHLFPVEESVQMGRKRTALTEILALADLCREDRKIRYSNRDKVNRVVDYMLDKYNEKLTLSQLAEIAGMSPSYFSSVFREVTGKSPIDYLIHLRIFKSKQLLSDGVSVTKVAEEVGFADIFYFSNVFKKLEGVSPAKYRAIH